MSPYLAELGLTLLGLFLLGCLLGALAWIDNRCPVHLMDHPLHNIHKEMAHDAGARARYAIAKATGETK